MRRRLSVVLAMTGDEAEDKAHYEYHGIEAVSGVQRGQGTAGRHNRAGDHESEHGADGAAGEDKVHSFGEATRVCCEPSVMIEV